jgi:hypothetical protein
VSVPVLALGGHRASFFFRDIPPVPKGLQMKTLLSIFAASGLVLSTAAAYAECGHQSAKINQVTASDTTAPATEEVVASTYDPQTIKKPVEAAKEQVTQ